MQKAVIVRTALEASDAESWSHEVDGTGESPVQPLRHYLANGWRVVHTCPMPSELDSCCLVILDAPEAERPKAESEAPTNTEMQRQQEWLSL